MFCWWSSLNWNVLLGISFISSLSCLLSSFHTDLKGSLLQVVEVTGNVQTVTAVTSTSPGARSATGARTPGPTAAVGVAGTAAAGAGTAEGAMAAPCVTTTAAATVTVRTEPQETAGRREREGLCRCVPCLSPSHYHLPGRGRCLNGGAHRQAGFISRTLAVICSHSHESMFNIDQEGLGVEVES